MDTSSGQWDGLEWKSLEKVLDEIVRCGNPTNGISNECV